MSQMDLIDADGIKYTVLRNHRQTFCYYITVIHRLHSSKTLNTLMTTSFGTITDPMSRKLMDVLRLYATSGDYDELKQYNDVLEEVINDEWKKGGYPTMLLLSLFVPIIHHYYPDYLIQILQEIRLERMHFHNTLESIEYFTNITNSQEYNANLNQWYHKMYESLPDKYVCDPFKVGIMMMLMKNDGDGHAVALIKNKEGKLYVVDDDRYIVELQSYLSQRAHRIKSIEIRDLDSETVSQLSDACAKFSEITINPKLYRTIISFPANMVGGNVKTKYITIPIIALLIVAIIGIIIFIVATSHSMRIQSIAVNSPMVH